MEALAGGCPDTHRLLYNPNKEEDLRPNTTTGPRGTYRGHEAHVRNKPGTQIRSACSPRGSLGGNPFLEAPAQLIGAPQLNYSK